ncbi:hypothetical protein HPT29_005880 [Microvirga terrae]|uniref:Uncharacterized protein n=1 Tax=Microvirga terrae TaxID=2740529 RepID=A0ABY5RV25_9HYPH|nr:MULTISPECIES: hypothetical protein [Microvirga]MBQ0821144.1 hypothetical protein [Microvirga sp. HBU67558]UVF20657.1 hypothetical protein HPT29_005880 [Microvirga terrae]
MPLLILKTLPFLFTISSATAGALPAQSWFNQQGYVGPSGGRIIACHGYGCVRRQQISVDGTWIDRARAALKAGQASPDAERRALGEVVRAYTAYLATSLGGKPDVPGSPPQMSGVYGQMDCLDETTNTTSLLLVLQEQGLLSHHIVEYPESRGFFLDGRYPHFTAVIAEKRTGAAWAVDPWEKAPGQRPDILPLTQWRQDS